MSDTDQRMFSGRQPAGRLRVGTLERDAAVCALQEHLMAGRLSSVEYEDRSCRAARARQWSDLVSLFLDLPEPRPRPGAPEGHVSPWLRLGSPVGSRWSARVMRVTPVVAVALTLITSNWSLLLLIPIVFILLQPSARAEQRRRRNEESTHAHPRIARKGDARP